MESANFDSLRGLTLVGELVRLTAPPAGGREICEQGIRMVAEAVGASGAVLMLGGEGSAPLEVAGRYGRQVSDETLSAARSAFAAGGTPVPWPGGSAPTLVIECLPGETGPMGTIVLEAPRAWDAGARSFVHNAARTLACAIKANRTILDSRRQRELLAQRNLELETLREMTLRLQPLDGESEMLSSALDLVLANLGLESGWIFWGEGTSGQLGLAASRGIAASFEERAKTSGIGHCLCQDVFETGRLRVARNTTECPRLPELLHAEEGSRTHACVPLKFEGGVLGVMNIANRPGKLFGEDELAFLETVGRQLCIAVDKAASLAKARDALTRLRQAQEEMIRAERLAAVGTLASSLAHEVRNPLNSINLQLVLLSRRLAQLNCDGREATEPIIEAARGEIDRLEGLVKEFLSLSSIDRLSPAPADPNEIVREVVDLMEPLAEEKGVTVEVGLTPGLPAVPLDREKMKQVLINIVRNAIEAIESAKGGGEGGGATAGDGGASGEARVEIATAREGGDAPSVRITVADTGPGLDGDVDVFAFFKTTKQGGTGLGLPIAQRIVEGHGGTLSHTDREGGGSVFTIALPVPSETNAATNEG